MKIDAAYLLEHPFPISVVTGAVNGLIIKLRNKNITAKTAVTLAAVQGFGEAILVMYEKPEDRGPVLRDMSLLKIGVLSSVGLVIGLAPFMFWRSQPPAAALPLPEPELVPALPGGMPVSGFGFYDAPKPRRRRRKKPSASRKR